jgi:hypothetical protein
MKRPLRVVPAYEDIEDEGNIDGKHTCFEGKFELVPVIDAGVEIYRVGRWWKLHKRLGP